MGPETLIFGGLGPKSDPSDPFLEAIRAGGDQVGKRGKRSPFYYLVFMLYSPLPITCNVRSCL